MAASAMLVACAAASSQTRTDCTGANVLRMPNGDCAPCGAAGQSCCPDNDPHSGPPFGDFCIDNATDCLATDTSVGPVRSCIACGHVGQRACASGCVEGFPERAAGSSVETCSCNVPAGMPALPGCNAQ